MKILAVDSTAVAASAALTDGTKLVGLYTVNTALTHSETLLPMVESLLKNAHMSVDDIDVFACSAGPGSFTGVRIGVSMIKGLAFAKNKPCSAVSSLEALAYNLNGFDGLICPVMDARRSQVYNALFKNGRRLTEDRLITLDELYSEIMHNYSTEKIYFVGDGYDLALNKSMLPNVCETPVVLRLQNAYSVACCVRETCSDIELSPVYLRASQAERERNARIAIDLKNNMEINGDNNGK